MNGRLTLADELLLLALDDRKGAVIPAAAQALPGSLSGAVLMELTIRGRLRTEPDNTVVAADGPSIDPIHDEAAARIARADRPRAADWWVRRLTGDMPDLRDRVLARLVADGVLRREERKVLWIIPRSGFPLADASAEREIRDRVRAAVLDGVTPDERTAALLGLVRACNLVDELFAPHERQVARARIAEMTAPNGAAAGAFGGGLQGALMGALLGATLGFALGAMLPDFGMDEAAAAEAPEAGESEAVAAGGWDAGGWGEGGDWE